MSEDRMVYLDGQGELACATAQGLVNLPSDFEDALISLGREVDLAIDCMPTFGGIPRPVAEALRKRLEVAQCAIDLALRGTQKAKVH